MKPPQDATEQEKNAYSDLTQTLIGTLAAAAGTEGSDLATVIASAQAEVDNNELLEKIGSAMQKASRAALDAAVTAIVCKVAVGGSIEGGFNVGSIGGYVSAGTVKDSNTGQGSAYVKIRSPRSGFGFIFGGSADFTRSGAGSTPQSGTTVTDNRGISLGLGFTSSENLSNGGDRATSSVSYRGGARVAMQVNTTKNEVYASFNQGEVSEICKE